jgi:hypothetical protein
MNDTCIINYATGFYIRGQIRLEQACRDVGYQGDLLLFNEDNVLPNCPSHSQVPYGFKPYAMKEAQKLGYRYILWCDSSVFPEKSIDPAFEIIKELGYLFFPGGWNTGQWCSDAALVTLGIERESAFDIPHMIAGCQGLDLNTAKAQVYLDKYFEYANDGVTFHGAWTNKNHEVSTDDRVKGHRHDQAAASVIAWKLGMRDWKPNVVIYDPDGKTKRKDTTIFVVRGA